MDRDAGEASEPSERSLGPYPRDTGSAGAQYRFGIRHAGGSLEVGRDANEVRRGGTGGARQLSSSHNFLSSEPFAMSRYAGNLLAPARACGLREPHLAIDD